MKWYSFPELGFVIMIVHWLPFLYLLEKTGIAILYEAGGWLVAAFAVYLFAALAFFIIADIQKNRESKQPEKNYS